MSVPLLLTAAVKAVASRPHTEAELRRKLTALCTRQAARARAARQVATGDDDKAWRMDGMPVPHAPVGGGPGLARADVPTTPRSTLATCDAAVEDVIERMRQLKLVDDIEYAAWHVRNRAAYRPRSKLQLRSELAAKGVAADVAAAAMAGSGMGGAGDGYDEVAACTRLARRAAESVGRKWGWQGVPPWPTALVADVKQRLWRRGFPVHVIDAAVAVAQRSPSPPWNPTPLQ